MRNSSKEGGSRLGDWVKQICESDRKVHWFASENLFISHNNTFFIEFLTLFHEK